MPYSLAQAPGGVKWSLSIFCLFSRYSETNRLIFEPFRAMSNFNCDIPENSIIQARNLICGHIHMIATLINTQTNGQLLGATRINLQLSPRT